MFSVGSGLSRCCDGVTRRDFLRVGSLSLLGLSGANLVAAQESGQLKPRGGRDKSCIMLFLVGAPSQNDTWDPHPDAPAEVRGPFGITPTNVPGIILSEGFPLLARQADQFALVRSMYHREPAIHETGHQLTQTGWLFRGGVEYPGYGSVVSYVKGAKTDLPPYVVLPSPIGNTGVSVPHGQDAGYLGKRYDPFYLNADPADPAFRVPDLDMPSGINPHRMRSRKELLNAVDNLQRQYERSEPARGRDAVYDRAFSLIFSPTTKKAFDIAGEPDSLRDRYGRNTFGQSCLLARRLIEHGVRLVTVNMFDTVFNEINWDCHAVGGTLASTLDDYKETLCPMLDLALSALLEDLYQRGLLDDTFVIALGEMGRTPKVGMRAVNGAGAGALGRDHWPQCWTILAAGGGVRGGRVIGSSDKTGAAPKDRPVGPPELAATIYHTLGIDPETFLRDQQNRQIALVDGQAKPVLELF